MIEFEEHYGKKLFPGDIRGLLSLPDVVGVLPLEDDLAEAYASEVESLLTGRSEAHVVDGALSSPCLCLPLSHSPTCGLLFPLSGFLSSTRCALLLLLLLLLLGPC